MQRASRPALIYAIIFFDLLAFGIIVPQLGIYARHFGADGLTQGLLVGSYSAMQFVFAPLLGRWSDRLGRRPVLLVSLFTSLVAHLLFAMAHSLPLLFAARLIDGVGGANVSTAQAYLSDVTPPERRAKAMASVGMSFGLGFILGPVVGAVLAPWGTHHWGVHGGNLAIGLLAALCSLLTLILTALMLPESLAPEQRHPATTPMRLIDLASLRSAFAITALRDLLLVGLISVAGFAVLHAILTYFLIDQLHLDVTSNDSVKAAQRATGIVFGFIGLVSFVVQGGIHAVAHKVSGVRLLRLGLVLQAVGLALLPLGGSLGLLLIWCLPLSVGTALTNALLPALLTLHSPDRRRGEVLGLSSSLGSIGRIGGPLCGGWLYDLSPVAPFVVGVVLTLVATALSWGVPEKHDEPCAEDRAGGPVEPGAAGV